SDVQSMRIHLDRTAARFRPLLRERPRDPAVYQALLQLFLWRRTADRAVMAGGVLTALGSPIPTDMVSQLEHLPPRNEPNRDGMRDATVDELLYPTQLAPGFRALFAQLAEPFTKLYGSDAKKLAQLGIDVKKERLPRSGHPVRDLANRIAQ